MSLQGTGNLQRGKAGLLRARESGRKDRVEGTLGEAQPFHLFLSGLVLRGASTCPGSAPGTGDTAIKGAKPTFQGAAVLLRETVNSAHHELYSLGSLSVEKMTLISGLCAAVEGAGPAPRGWAGGRIEASSRDTEPDPILKVSPGRC